MIVRGIVFSSDGECSEPWSEIEDDKILASKSGTMDVGHHSYRVNAGAQSPWRIHSDQTLNVSSARG